MDGVRAGGSGHVDGRQLAVTAKRSLGMALMRQQDSPLPRDIQRDL